MSRRIAAFTLVWAYVCGALWLLIGAPETFYLCLVPPGYFFAAGLFFGFIHEVPASRWPRPWVTAAVLAIALELGIFLYGGHSVGLSLGSLFATATICASMAAKSLSNLKPLLAIGTIIGSLATTLWLVSSGVDNYSSAKMVISPDGAFRALILKGPMIMDTPDSETSSFHVGPKYGWHGAFGRQIVIDDFMDENHGYQSIKVKTFSWKGAHKIHLTGLFPRELPSPNPLLPIPITTTEIQ